MEVSGEGVFILIVKFSSVGSHIAELHCATANMYKLLSPSLLHFGGFSY